MNQSRRNFLATLLAPSFIKEERKLKIIRKDIWSKDAKRLAKMPLIMGNPPAPTTKEIYD